ncbi:ComEA family DNA-binding protein [Rhodococcoides corynebacterioides]|uniref:ComEA family DNA-binding protein n=1 Tax=Rhodococcoides corynebacterioides TaxID=53972 RepID=UPI00082C754D|nr:ComEA family DNA-binding protein [Rhodococcus corynebacterioides]MBY6349693.1 ComEA family DNA-binding protein [Rhodococcus corynebacterioides]MBY6363479.1 ComEA family DNA-binding protein [Rhodococcus corynebacterioides]
MTSPEPDADLDAPPAGPARRPRSVRLDLGSRGFRALLVVGVVLVLGTAGLLMRDAPEVVAVPPLPPVAGPAVESAPSAEPDPPASVVVSVVGAVVRPGLVTVPPGSRVADAVAAAGGHRPDADMLTLNWARPVADGEQVVVGVAGAASPVAGVLPAGDTPPTAGSAGGIAAAGRVSLNAATESDLDALPGVGPVTAAAIVAWREENGPFASVDQLAEVTGIGPARLQKLTELVVP